MTLYDSGMTIEQIDALAEEFSADLLDEDSRFIRTLEIGLLDGDIIPGAGGGTVELSTPRAELERRIAAIRAGVASGLSLARAVSEAVADRKF